MNNATSRTAMAAYFATQAPWAALYSTAGGATAGTELTGGSPAYARKAGTWGTAASSAVTSSPPAFDVASGSTVAGAGYHSASTAGTYWEGGSVTSQAFSSQGTYTLTGTYTQS